LDVLAQVLLTSLCSVVAFALKATGSDLVKILNVLIHLAVLIGGKARPRLNEGNAQG
jgi:hypothetical protein